jgi:hypothetical protein
MDEDKLLYKQGKMCLLRWHSIISIGQGQGSTIKSQSEQEFTFLRLEFAIS